MTLPLPSGICSECGNSVKGLHSGKCISCYKVALSNAPAVTNAPRPHKLPSRSDDPLAQTFNALQAQKQKLEADIGRINIALQHLNPNPTSHCVKWQSLTITSLPQTTLSLFTKKRRN